MQARAGQPFAIACNTTITQPIVWIQTVNGTGVYTVANTSRVFPTQNGLYLNFTAVNLVDQEYYACAYYDQTNTIKAIQSFYLYVKVYPLLSIVVGQTIYNETDVITLNASYTYELACLAIDAKPDVNLELIDSNTFESLGNSTNSLTQHSCGANNLCNVIYQVTLVLNAGSPFLTMTSITCLSKSVLPDINLDYSIKRTVKVLNNSSPIGKQFNNCKL